MASYPNATKYFINKVDGVNIVHAADINEPCGEITAIELELGLNPAGIYPNVAGRISIDEVYLSAAQATIAELVTGWAGAVEIWTYASATTFTISGDYTAKFTAGVKLKLTQTTVKYFYVVSSSYSAPNTTVTITGGTDYSLANAAITAKYISRFASPEGFPHYFAFTPTWTASSGNAPVLGNGSLIGRFCIIGKKVTINFVLSFGTTTTGGSGGFWIFSLPVACAGVLTQIGLAQVRDAAVASYPRMTQILVSSPTSLSNFTQLDAGLNVNTLTNTAPFAFADLDSVSVQMDYEMA